MHAGNDLWTRFSNTSLCCRNTSNWARAVRQAKWRASAAAPRPSLLPHCGRVTAPQQQFCCDSCQAAVPCSGLYDKFYAQSVKCRQLQLAKHNKRLQRCRSNDCSCTSNWITVYGFPPAAADEVLHFFHSLGRVCGKRLADGNWFHLAYVNSIDCWRAERFNELPIRCLKDMRVGVRRWQQSQLPGIENVNQCEGGLWQRTPLQGHWGRKIMQYDH